RRESSAPARRVRLREQHVVAEADQPPYGVGRSFQHKSCVDTLFHRAGPSGRSAEPIAGDMVFALRRSSPVIDALGIAASNTLPPGASKLPVNAYSNAMARAVWVVLAWCSCPLQA